jgi:HJR/Mrr/RecB family endonuclease
VSQQKFKLVGATVEVGEDELRFSVTGLQRLSNIHNKLPEVISCREIKGFDRVNPEHRSCQEIRFRTDNGKYCVSYQQGFRSLFTEKLGYEGTEGAESLIETLEEKEVSNANYNSKSYQKSVSEGSEDKSAIFNSIYKFLGGTKITVAYSVLTIPAFLYIFFTRPDLISPYWTGSLAFYWTSVFQRLFVDTPVKVFFEEDELSVSRARDGLFVATILGLGLAYILPMIIFAPIIEVYRRLKDRWEKKEAYRNYKKEVASLYLPKKHHDEAQQVLEDIENGESEAEIEQKVQKLKKEERMVFSEEIERFVQKYGLGENKEIENLKKLLNNKGAKLEEERVREMVKFKVKEEFNSKMDKYEPQSYEESLEVFAKEFGNSYGDPYLRECFKDYTNKEEVKQDIKDKHEEIVEKREIKKFGEDLYSGDKAQDILKNITVSGIEFDKIEEMDGVEFEELIANLFEQKGYSTNVTSATGDQGADVIAEKGLEKVAIQAKRYSGKVSNSAVQEVVASMEHYDASDGIVITNSKFTSSAKDLASSNNIELWNGEKLKEQLEGYSL